MLIRGRVAGVPGSDVPFNVDSSGNLSAATPGTVVAGVATIATAGAAVCLGTATLTSGINVKALDANGGTAYVGGFAVSSSAGYELKATESVFVEVDALEQIWVDTNNNGDKVSYIGG